MALRRRKGKFKEWLLSFFPSKEVYYVPDGPQRHAGKGGFFSHAQDFSINNSTMIQGDQVRVTYVQGDRNVIAHVMNLLSQHIIPGAAHDDSARVPPPRCHPGTRLNLIARITTWFNDETRPELLLWITGPAGVGKSAVVQTFAEYLFKLKLLGASVFCSRPNKRNNSHLIFITIAYQLAIRIEAYREFVVERLSLDPQLLNRDIASQFTTFIIEPFVERKIGAGGKPWGVLLDGLDELKGEDAQCEIIQLVSNFAHEHRDAPLLWIIASRPEPHISNTFEDNANQSHRSEYIPIDSTEACKDVEHFLRASFETTRKKFRQSVSQDWPSDTDLLKVSAAASGLFIYAEVVMQFLRDPDYADPVARLKLLLSIIDHSNAISSNNNPFFHLDALYREILSAIPSALWPTTKRLLGFLTFQEQSNIVRPTFATLRAMSILFGLTQHAIYACLIKCHSTLKIPDWEVADRAGLTILHASFSDYLKDSRRSGDFYVGSDEDAASDMLLSVFRIWNRCSEGIDISSVESTWHQYCSELDAKSPSWSIAKFQTKLLLTAANSIVWATQIVFNEPSGSSLYAQLLNVHIIKLSNYANPYSAAFFVNTLMTIETNDTRLLQRIHFKDLRFEHLDWKEMSPARFHYGKCKLSFRRDWLIHRPRSRAGLEMFVSELVSIRERSPELAVTVFGGVPGGRVAVFRIPLKGQDKPEFHRDYASYIIPYPG